MLVANLNFDSAAKSKGDVLAMARFNEPQTKDIYQAAALFLEKCLCQDGSLLFDNQKVWVPEGLAKIHEHLVEKPDLTSRNFDEKYHDQIKRAGFEYSTLAAELLCVYFLFPSNVGGTRKREVVKMILNWDNKTLSDGLISKAFDTGIGSGGSGYSTRRPFELEFLIKFAIEWKKQQSEQQKEISTDPWKFSEFVYGVLPEERKQSRHMLLHLLFPDTFERISSENHKVRVVKAFSGLLDDESKDDHIEKKLFRIRQTLVKLLPDKNNLDFYSAPLEQTWYDSGEGEATETISLDLICHKKQVVLYGPPGTGKTYRAKQLAERIIRSIALANMGASVYFQSQDEVSKAIEDNVHRLQMHPAYTYEQFVVGLHLSENGATEFRLGALPKLIEKMNSKEAGVRLPHVLILDEINRADLSRVLGECFSLLENRNESVKLPAHGINGEQIALTIPEDLYIIGTMNLIDQSVEQIDFALRRRFLWMACPFDQDALLGVSKSKWQGLKNGISWSRVESDFRTLGEVAQTLNSEIAKSKHLGRQYEIGHAYFLDAVPLLHKSLDGLKKKTFLWNGKGEGLEPVHQLWKFSLEPLLSQYLVSIDEQSRKDLLQNFEHIIMRTRSK